MNKQITILIETEIFFVNSKILWTPQLCYKFLTLHPSAQYFTCLLVYRRQTGLLIMGLSLDTKAMHRWKLSILQFVLGDAFTVPVYIFQISFFFPVQCVFCMLRNLSAAAFLERTTAHFSQTAGVGDQRGPAAIKEFTHDHV